MKRFASLSFFLVLLVASLARAEALKEGDVVAICGDSITEQKEYSVFIANYLLMCQPAAKLRAHQFGWSGEVAPGFRARMEYEVGAFKPSVATTCYGMNDGGYSPMTPDKAKRYYDAQKSIVQAFKKMGVRFIVVGSPGVVDLDSYKRTPHGADVYNKTLAEERDLARKVAEEEGVGFANVYDAMMDAMVKAKAKLGPNYHVAGGDGFHPGKNGQLCMAYAFLKALGCDGNLGTITVDLGADQAQATGGHRVVAAKGGALTVESTRYPFCFYGDEATPHGTRSIVPFLPFNDELNRFTLIVKGGGAKSYKVTWSDGGPRKGDGALPAPPSKVFSAEQLAKGINLAAEFPDNPFSEPFKRVEQAVRAQQNFETPLVKDLMHNLPRFQKMVPEEREAFDRILAAALKRTRMLREEAAAAVQPVGHTLMIEKAE